MAGNVRPASGEAAIARADRFKDFERTTLASSITLGDGGFPSILEMLSLARSNRLRGKPGRQLPPWSNFCQVPDCLDGETHVGRVH